MNLQNKDTVLLFKPKIYLISNIKNLLIQTNKY